MGRKVRDRDGEVSRGHSRRNEFRWRPERWKDAWICESRTGHAAENPGGWKRPPPIRWSADGLRPADALFSSSWQSTRRSTADGRYGPIAGVTAPAAAEGPGRIFRSSCGVFGRFCTSGAPHGLLVADRSAVVVAPDGSQPFPPSIDHATHRRPAACHWQTTA